jgi:NADH-quinone oxidoreductase subunit J
MESFLFYVIVGVTGLCAIAVVVTHNIVRAATWLLFTLAGTSAIFFLLGADLVGATQLLVYVGGTLVLVIFGVMLTAQGPFISMKTSSAEWAISATVGLILLVVLGLGVMTLPRTGLSRPPLRDNAETELVEKAMQAGNLSRDPASAPYSAVIGEGFLGVPVGPPHVERPDGTPRAVRAHYLLPFEIVSVHLLVVLIGAAYLARAKRRKAGGTP